MAVYRRVYDSRPLQVDCQEPGSAPEPYATFTCFYCSQMRRCLRVTDDEAVTRRHAVPAVERVQSDSAERQQNLARHAAADPRLGSTPDPGVYSSLCISSN